MWLRVCFILQSLSLAIPMSLSMRNELCNDDVLDVTVRNFTSCYYINHNHFTYCSSFVSQSLTLIYHCSAVTIIIIETNLTGLAIPRYVQSSGISLASFTVSTQSNLTLAYEFNQIRASIAGILSIRICLKKPL
jgi:hypothetical protein